MQKSTGEPLKVSCRMEKNNANNVIKLKDETGKDVENCRTAEFINQLFVSIGPKLAKSFDSAISS